MDAGKKFKGFMILSRRANVDDEQENRPVGSFREVAGTQHVCEGVTTFTDDWSLFSSRIVDKTRNTDLI